MGWVQMVESFAQTHIYGTSTDIIFTQAAGCTQFLYEHLIQIVN